MRDLRRDQASFDELSAGLLSQGSAIRFRAHGESMAPQIRDGDVLTVEPATVADLRVGDVALHRTGEGPLVVHRVVRRRAGGGRVALATRGDAVLGPADLVREQDVLGRVTARERDGRAVDIGRGLRRLGGRLLVAFLAVRRPVARFHRSCRRLAARVFQRP